MKEKMFSRLHTYVMQQPCAQEDHYPLKVAEQQTDQGSITFGYLRTNSYQMDGCGGRTDAHDLLSLFWACVLRANGAASTRLVDEAGFVPIPGEIYARWLIFDQVGDLSDPNPPKAKILAHTAFAFHALDDVVGWGDIMYPQARWTNGAKELVDALNSSGSFTDFDDMAGIRECPDWYYAKSLANGITVAILPPARAAAFRVALAAYDPVCVSGRSRVSIVGSGLKNAVAHRTISSGLRLLRSIEPESSLPWKGAGSAPLDKAIALIPLESHCVFVGMQSIVAIAADCGIRSFETERTKFLVRRSAENAVFSVDYAFEWTERIDGGRFEDLVYALLEREKGVAWVRQAGPTRERDGGRDFIARWLISSGHGLDGSASNGIPEPAILKSIVVQVKAHQPSVGKAKVVDIRDTIERHDAEGYFLVAFPQPANSLVEHLVALARRGTWTDWWDRAQIESRLRLNLDLLARFSDLVVQKEREI